jgi:hypothetical protein
MKGPGLILRLAGSATFVLAVAACGRPRECADVLAALASDEGALGALSPDAGDDPRELSAHMRVVAGAEDDVASRFLGMKIADASLAAAAADYAGAARDAASAARALEGALAAMSDVASGTLAVVDDAARTQALLRALCKTATPDCAAVDGARRAVVGDAFQNAERDAQIAALERAAAALAALRLGDAALAAGAKDYAGVLARWAEEMRREGEVLVEVDEGQKRLAAVVLRKKPIEDRIHAACHDRP